MNKKEINGIICSKKWAINYYEEKVKTYTEQVVRNKAELELWQRKVKEMI